MVIKLVVQVIEVQTLISSLLKNAVETTVKTRQQRREEQSINFDKSDAFLQVRAGRSEKFLSGKLYSPAGRGVTKNRNK